MANGVHLQRNLALVALAHDQALPSLGTLAHNIHGVLLVLALPREGELILGLAVRDFVNTEPLVRGAEETGEVTLDIFDVVELGSQRVLHVNNNDLPVSLLLVKEGHDTKNLDLLDLTGLCDELTDLADVERVIVPLGFGLRVNDVGVLPSLSKVRIPSSHGRLVVCGPPYLRESSVVPEVTLVGEAIADEAKLALLDVLLDRVEPFLLRDLRV